MLVSEVMRRRMLLLKASLLRRVTNIPIPYGDFKKHINHSLKHKRQSQWDEAVNNMKFIIICGLEVLELLGVRRVLTRIRIGHTHSVLLKKEDSHQCVACDCLLTVKHI